MRVPTTVLCLIAAFALVAAACGDTAETTSPTTPAATEAPATAAPTTEPPATTSPATTPTTEAPVDIDAIAAANAYVAAMAADDMDSVAGFATEPSVMQGFIEWQIALRADPILSDCVESRLGDELMSVSCTLTYGDEYFHAVITGEPFTSKFGGTVDADGAFYGNQWPPPTGLSLAESDFRAWVQEAHPEMEDEMWGGQGFLGYTMTRESGELRMSLMDEYMEARA